MATGQFNALLRHIRTLVGADVVDERSDGSLLQRFVLQQDESAFEALAERHGPLVLSLCRRLLRDVHEADDAFQATFLVLARKAASIRSENSVGSWLYGVAYRVALAHVWL